MAAQPALTLSARVGGLSETLGCQPHILWGISRKRETGCWCCRPAPGQRAGEAAAGGLARGTREEASRKKGGPGEGAPEQGQTSSSAILQQRGKQLIPCANPSLPEMTRELSVVFAELSRASHITRTQQVLVLAPSRPLQLFCGRDE